MSDLNLDDLSNLLTSETKAHLGNCEPHNITMSFIGLIASVTGATILNFANIEPLLSNGLWAMGYLVWSRHAIVKWCRSDTHWKYWYYTLDLLTWLYIYSRATMDPYVLWWECIRVFVMIVSCILLYVCVYAEYELQKKKKKGKMSVMKTSSQQNGKGGGKR